MPKIVTTESWIKMAKAVHGRKYDYSLVDYENNRKHVTIICPIHGEFEQKPYVHLAGKGCPKCGEISKAKKKTLTTKKFISKAKKVHGDKYDYSQTEYKGSHEPVEIICPVHGKFSIRACDHLRGKGCGKCKTECLE